MMYKLHDYKKHHKPINSDVIQISKELEMWM